MTELEILQASHAEHFKALKEMSTFLPFGHWKLKMIELEMNALVERINHLKKIQDGQRKHVRTSKNRLQLQ